MSFTQNPPLRTPVVEIADERLHRMASQAEVTENLL